MDKIYTIYGYFNTITLMWYVGRTCQKPTNRAGKNGHGYLLQPKFYSAIQEFGWPSFEYHTLATTTDLEESYRLEQYWIEQKNSVENGYNVSGGGKSSFYGIHDNYRTGTKHTEETKRKIGISNSLAQKGKPKPYFQKPVYQFTLDGQFKAKYPSIKEAQKQTGFKHISCCCRGERKSAGGFIWTFAD